MRAVLLATLLIAALSGWSAEEKNLELLLEMRPGRGDKPMTVVWVEDVQGRYVETLEICSQAVRWFPDFKRWRVAQNGRITQEIDGLIGATIRWGGKRLIEIPAKVGQDLLDGNHVLCIESIADGGEHYGVLKVPLARDFKETTVEHEGYVSRATVRLAGAEDAAPPEAEPAVSGSAVPTAQKMDE